MQCAIARRLFEMIAAINAEQKIPRDYCSGYTLYRAEIDLLEKIDEYPQLNVSMLSQKSGVTKSAVTQMTVRLLDKGLIERYQNPHNRKEKYFRLTQNGSEVRKQHEEYNQTAAEQIQRYLCSLSSSDKKIILDFMDIMKQYMPVCAFSCQHASAENSCTSEKEEREKEE